MCILTFYIPEKVKYLYQVVTDFHQHPPQVNEFLKECPEFVAYYPSLYLKENKINIKDFKLIIIRL